MDLSLSADDLAFQAEVRAFLDAELTPELRRAGRRTTSVFSDREDNLAWLRILNARGWAAPGWPVEHGGAGWSEIQRAIFAAECARAGAPALSPMGLRMVAPVIMRYGTDAQKAHYLPRILAGEDYWCQGYSEPGSGSDLASLALAAVRDGDDYVLNGSKIWTTHAHWANRMFCLVRTDASGKRQAGITFLLLDMTTPGISVRPIITLAGDHEVNQVFFEDVRVPVANRLGEENDGWTVAKTLLEFERGGGSAPGLKVWLDRLWSVAVGEGLAEDADVRRKLATAGVAVEAIDMTEQRVLAEAAAGGRPGPASSMLKTQGTEAMQRLDEIGVELLGAYAAVWQPEAGRGADDNEGVVGPEIGPVLTGRYWNNRAASIYGGSNEVQRNIMAAAVLGLR